MDYILYVPYLTDIFTKTEQSILKRYIDILHQKNIINENIQQRSNYITDLDIKDNASLINDPILNQGLNILNQRFGYGLLKDELKINHLINIVKQFEPSRYDYKINDNNIEILSDHIQYNITLLKFIISDILIYQQNYFTFNPEDGKTQFLGMFNETLESMYKNSFLNTELKKENIIIHDKKEELYINDCEIININDNNDEITKETMVQSLIGMNEYKNNTIWLYMPDINVQITH